MLGPRYRASLIYERRYKRLKSKDRNKLMTESGSDEAIVAGCGDITIITCNMFINRDLLQLIPLLKHLV